jgi:hypothetical protein
MDRFAPLFQKRKPSGLSEKTAFSFCTGVPRNERSRVLGVRGAFSFGPFFSKEKAL